MGTEIQRIENVGNKANRMSSCEDLRDAVLDIEDDLRFEIIREISSSWVLDDESTEVVDHSIDSLEEIHHELDSQGCYASAGDANRAGLELTDARKFASNADWVGVADAIDRFIEKATKEQVVCDRLQTVINDLCD